MDSVTGLPSSLLQGTDVEIHNLMKKEKRWQPHGFDLSASEVFTPNPVDEAVDYDLANYSKGMPGNRRNQCNDALTNLCCERALRGFRLDPAVWSVKVLSSSGRSTALLATCTTLVPSYGCIIGHDLFSVLPSAHRVGTSGTKNYFLIIPFVISPSTSRFDYDKIEEQVQNCKPHLIVCGGSAYPRDWDYRRLRLIADNHDTILLCDMTNISGLVAAQESASPFESCHIVTSTYKSSKGTAGLIFYRKDQPKNRGLCASVENTPVFPSLQGGPCSHQIYVLAICLKLVTSDDFRAYARQVKANAVALGNFLVSKGYKLVTNGTDNHLVLWDLHPLGLAGNKVEKLCNLCGITVKKNAVFDGSSATASTGILIGTHAMTSWGLVEEDFEPIAEFLHRAVSITLSIQRQHGRKMKDFNKGLYINKDIEDLKNEVDRFSHFYQLRLSRDRD